MRTNVSKLIETSKASWKQAKFQGVEYMPLTMDLPERMGSMIVRMSPQAAYPRHRHPGPEEIYILKGSLTIGEHTLKSGDYFHTPAGLVHQMSTVEGCIFFLSIPGGIDIVPESNFEDLDAPPSSPLEEIPQI